MLPTKRFVNGAHPLQYVGIAAIEQTNIDLVSAIGHCTNYSVDINTHTHTPQP